MSTKLQVRSIRAYYHTDTTKSKIMVKINGIVPSGSEPDITLFINNGTKTLTAQFVIRQTVDNHSNTMLTYITNGVIKAVDKITCSNAANLPTWYDKPVSNHITVDSGTDQYDYKMTVEALTVNGDAVFGHSSEQGQGTLIANRSPRLAPQVHGLTVDATSGALRLTCGDNGTDKFFGDFATISLEAIAPLPTFAQLMWSPSAEAYLLDDAVLLPLAQEFSDMEGAVIGFTIVAHN